MSQILKVAHLSKRIQSVVYGSCIHHNVDPDNPNSIPFCIPQVQTRMQYTDMKIVQTAIHVTSFFVLGIAHVDSRMGNGKRTTVTTRLARSALPSPTRSIGSNDREGLKSPH